MGPAKRSPAMVIVLYFITCGIYFYYWVYQVSKETKEFLGDDSINPGMEVLLSFVTCTPSCRKGIWVSQASSKARQAARNNSSVMLVAPLRVS